MFYRYRHPGILTALLAFTLTACPAVYGEGSAQPSSTASPDPVAERGVLRQHLMPPATNAYLVSLNLGGTQVGLGASAGHQLRLDVELRELSLADLPGPVRLVARLFEDREGLGVGLYAVIDL